MHKAGRSLFVCAGLLGLAFLLPRPTAAAWPSDPLVNLPVCTAGNDQSSPTAVSDGAGGVIVTWTDERGGSSTGDIYAQRISADGALQWTADGVALCTASSLQDALSITSDGAGGAIVAWSDYRSGFQGTGNDIYVQRISADGTVLWTADGVALCTATSFQGDPTITSDGAGGAIVAWIDGRSGNSGIYAQHVLASGAADPAWPADGRALCTAGGSWGFHTVNVEARHGGPIKTIVSDGAGGAIVTWFDQRSGTDCDIYAQRISATGAVQWPTNGVALCTAPSAQLDPTIVSDGAGGAIVTWWDSRSGYANIDIYAQRISAGGTVQWTADGVALCTADNTQMYPDLTSDGTGGAIVTWWDDRSGSGDIYAQRVGRDGVPGNADVPPEVSLAFALDPVRPNPTRGGSLTVRFTLPTSAPARLELLDVAGRRIAEHEVGSGQHTLDFGAGQHLAPGLYLVRLTQGANTRTTRVVVLR